MANKITGLFCCGLVVGLPTLFIAINAAILFWLAKDAKSRGMDGAMWLFLIFFTGVIGLAIYLFSRPQGRLTQCHNCGNNRMEASIKCPHCGAGKGRQENPGDLEGEEDRPVVKQSKGRSIIICSHCGARLRLPAKPSAFGQEFTCPSCKNTIEAE